MEKSSLPADPYFQAFRLWLKSDEMIKGSLKITTQEKALAEKFTQPARKNHFLLGRHYAHQLLTEMGYPQKTIGKNNNGSPVWGKGIKGSISHCKGQLVICISDSSNLRSVGVDIESCSRKINQSILKKISHSQEFQITKNFGKISPKETLFIFCLKEAILKCFGSLGEKIEFQDIIITSLKPTLVDIPRFKLKNQKAHLIQTGNFVVAVFILPA